VRLAEIINEIDVYLLRLRQARDLLAASTMTEQRSRARSRQTAVSARNGVRATRNVQPLPEKKLPAGITTRTPKPAAENLCGSHNRVFGTAESAERNEPALSAPEPALPQVEGTLSLQKENTRATPQRRRPVRQERAPVKIETSLRPATASNKPIPNGWIVVSAEEAKRQREPEAHLAQLRSATPSRGLTGRKAFEALFGDTAESSDRHRTRHCRFWVLADRLVRP
jgi:hypothetical protein